MDCGVKRIWTSKLFLGSILIYSLIQSLRMIGWRMPDVLNNYLTDLVCLPIVLSICLIGARYFKRDSSIRLTVWMIAAIWLQYSLIFEWILPLKSNSYRGDWLDVLAYGVGAVVFYFWQKNRF